MLLRIQMAWLVLLAAAWAPWGCSSSPSGGAQLPTCEEGDILQYVAGKWDCGPATNLLPTCATGQTAFWDGIQWSCANFVPPPATCMDGDVLQQVHNAWTCQPVPLPKTMGCLTGEALIWDGSEWACGPNLTQALGSPDGLGAQLGIMPVAQTSQYAADGGTITPSLGLTMSASKTAAAASDCLDVDHNWGTNAVGVAAWIRASGDSNAPWTQAPVMAITQPDDNTVRLCNTSGAAADLSLLVWH